MMNGLQTHCGSGLRAAAIIAALVSSMAAKPLTAPSYETFTLKEADNFTKRASTALAPVYPALAAYLADSLYLSHASGIGIDLGSGPGDLIIELCKRTDSLYWINADINTYYFQFFFDKAVKAGVVHRVGAVFADAQCLPFRDNYADAIVSRGSFEFWENKTRAFGEINRVLKPGGIAFIGRGYSGNLAPEVAASIRKEQSDGGPRYTVDSTARELKEIMRALSITDFEIIVPAPKNATVKYGIWIRFRKKTDR